MSIPVVVSVFSYKAWVKTSQHAAGLVVWGWQAVLITCQQFWSGHVVQSQSHKCVTLWLITCAIDKMLNKWQTNYVMKQYVAIDHERFYTFYSCFPFNYCINLCSWQGIYNVKNRAGRKLMPDDRCNFSTGFSMFLANCRNCLHCISSTFH